ncbi:MAG TPA: hypothetical protein VJ622_10775 [Acidimicrobiia bacterium]|nr:hypothetical protein [Acidimicrobiia bacterium]
MTTRRKRMIGRGLGAALLLAGGGSLLPGAAHAEDSPPADGRSLVAVASASGMRVGYSVPDQFAVSQFVDGGGPVAQASLDSTGKAIGFGSLPYPGENAVAAPGVLTLATKVPVPSYPFYAEASYPVTPSSEVKDPSGTYDLAAKAEQHKAEGRAALDFGGSEKPVARVVSTASGSIDPAGASVTAVSVGEGFRFGDGLLTIASGTSRSVTTYTNGAAKPETKGELVIEGAKVGDQAVTIGPDGVHPAGQTVRSPGGADQLNQALAAAGITVRTLSLQTGDGGATAEALQVVVKHPIPGSKVSGTFVYEFGGSTSSIAFGAAGAGVPAMPGGIEGAPTADAGTPTTSPSAAAPAASPASGVEPAAVPAGGSTSAPPATSSPLSGGAALPGGADTGQAASSPAVPAELGAPAAPEASLEVASEPAALARLDLKKPGRVLMAVLAAAGAILLAASTFWRKAL